MTPHYKKIVKIARRLGLRDSLQHIWAYNLHVSYAFNLPSEYRHTANTEQPIKLSDYIREFHLDLHAREVLLYSGKSSQATHSLKEWNDFSEFHNAIINYGNEVSGKKIDIWLTIHRIGHQQIFFFDRVNSHYLGRYWSLFKRKPIAELLERRFGMSVLEYFLLTAGVFAIYLTKPESDLFADLAVLKIPEEAMRARIEPLSATLQEMRNRLSSQRKLGSSWEYTFNDLNLTPLLIVNKHKPNKLFCPRPQLLVRRLLSGAYFDLVGETGFSKAFGDAVEDLVGDLIQRSDPRLLPRKPTPYRTGEGLRHGTDWLLSDGSGHVFIECKSARIPLQAKVALATDDVLKGMQRLAAAIVQNYSNIEDALQGRSGFQTKGLPIHSLIVTLEDWILFSPLASNSLRELVEQKLTAKGSNPAIVQTSPYVVVSVRDLPNLMHAMAECGIEPLFLQKCSQKYDQHLVSSFLDEAGLKSEMADSIFKFDNDELFKEFRARFKTSTTPTPLVP